jgi:hypothetical protein
LSLQIEGSSVVNPRIESCNPGIENTDFRQTSKLLIFLEIYPKLQHFLLSNTFNISVGKCKGDLLETFFDFPIKLVKRFTIRMSRTLDLKTAGIGSALQFAVSQFSELAQCLLF